jgi:hypothetical protein
MNRTHKDGTHLSLILRKLATEGPQLTTDLIPVCGYQDCPVQRGQAKVGNIVRRAIAEGLVRVAGKSQTGWQQCGTFRYDITSKGLSLISWWDAMPEREAAARSAKQARQVRLEELAGPGRRALETALAAGYSKLTPRWKRQEVAAELRGHSLSLRRIATVFGVSAEMIRLDLIQPAYSTSPPPPPTGAASHPSRPKAPAGNQPTTPG